MLGLRRSLPVTVTALLAFGLFSGPVRSCPFCNMQGQTLSGEVDQATLVLFGTFGKGDEVNDKTPLNIETVIKDNPVRGKKMTITIDRYIPPAPDKVQYKYLVFCEIFRGKLDAYRGVAVKSDSRLPEYLKGALKLKKKLIGDRLRFYFNYLNDPDLEVSNDAFKEFARTDYRDYRGMAKDLPAGLLVKWLKDPKTSPLRLGLYASLLGHCGKDKDADVLRKLLDDPDRRIGSGVDGMLAAYTMLRPKEGWKYIRDALKDPKQEFIFRYAALRAVRFIHDFRDDLVSKKELVEALCLLLDQDDIADLAIEDLRKWKCWDKADKVLGVQKGAAYKLPIVRRAVLRFGLCCKGSGAAKAYVAARRKEDPEAVKEAEELLKLEEDASKPAAPSKGGK